MPVQASSFWDFSVELYKLDKVSENCLALQNDFDLDVNLILFCYWHGRAFGIIEKDRLEQVVELSRNWKRSVVQPLRDVRKWMKLNAELFASEQAQQYDTLRERIKSDELGAEKYQQESMEKLIQSSTEAALIGSEVDAEHAAVRASKSNLLKLLALLGHDAATESAIEPRLNIISGAFCAHFKA